MPTQKLDLIHPVHSKEKTNASDSITFEIENIIKALHLKVIAIPIIFSKNTNYLCLMLDRSHRSFDAHHLFRTVQQLVAREYYNLPKILQVSRNFNYFVATQYLLLGKANIVGTTRIDRAKNEVTLHQYELVLLDNALAKEALELLSEASKKVIPVIIYTADDLNKGTLDKKVLKEISIPTMERIPEKES